MTIKSITFLNVKIVRGSGIKMKPDLIPINTRCSECNYVALTWHENVNRLEECRKCKGKLEIIMGKNNETN